MAATGVSNNSLEDFYKAQVGTEIGGPAGIGMLNQYIGPINRQVMPATPNANSFASSAAAEATTGVGQMAITTGANTPGIGSFAMPIAGPSRAGGTGNPDLPSVGPDQARLVDPKVAAATDAAIESLDAESQDASNAEDPRQSRSDKVSRRATPTQSTPRRAWNIDPDKSESLDAEPTPGSAPR
jgi:hypothetical protein